LEDILLMGDRKMPTAENPLPWLRLNLGDIGPITLQDPHRQTLRDVWEAGHTWQAVPYVATREAATPPAPRPGSRGLGHTVTVPHAPSRHWSVRHLSVHSSTLASREAARRQNDMPAIEAALPRLQGWVNKYDDKTPEIIPRRVQSKAFKKRPAQTYFTIEAVPPAARPTAPLELHYRVDDAQVQRAAELDGVSLVVAGGKAATLSDAEIVAAWKGQDKVEHCFRLVNQRFLVPPLCLKTPQRIAALVFLLMVGALVAGLIERQVRRALAERRQPSTALMPEGRDTWRPTVERLFKAFADYSLVQVTDACGQVVESRFARLHPVQAYILKMLGLPQPAELFAQPVLSCVGAEEDGAWHRDRTVKGLGSRGTTTWQAVRGGAATALARSHRSGENVFDHSMAKVVQDSRLFRVA